MGYLLKMAFALAIPALVLAGCGTNHSWNQKLTIKVNTPSGEKIGSAVTRVSVTVGRQFATDTILSFGVRGEAAVVDLGGGKYLFALLSNSGPGNTEYLADNTLGHPVMIGQNQDEVSRLNTKYSAYENLRGAVPVPPKNYPASRHLHRHQQSQEREGSKIREFADAFGAGYSLKAVTLEITDEEATTGKIKSTLKWIDDYCGLYFDGGSNPNPQNQNIANHIGDANFRTGE